MEQSIVGFAWWQSTQWNRLKDISEDSKTLDDSYEEWRDNANSAIGELQAQGQIVKKIGINLDDLIAWCDDKKTPINGASRADFTVHILQQRHAKQ